MVEAVQEVSEPRWRRVLIRIPWRAVTGLAAIGLIIAGVWGLWGWQWAAIATGFPVAAFYLFGEIIEVRNKIATNPREGD